MTYSFPDGCGVFEELLSPRKNGTVYMSSLKQQKYLRLMIQESDKESITSL